MSTQRRQEVPSSLADYFAASLNVSRSTSSHNARGRSPPDLGIAKLPYELCVMILEHACSRVDAMSPADHQASLGALCLVNSMFREECQSALFRTLHYSGNTRFAHQRKMRDWLERLQARDPRATQLAGWVRECSFSEWFKDGDAWETHWHFQSAVLETATFFTQLHTIALVRCPLSVDVLRVIARMPQVRTVSFTHCPCSVPSLAVEARADSLPAARLWTHLTLDNTFARSPSPETLALGMLAPHLARLVNLEQLHTLTTDCWPLLTLLLGARPPAPALKTLHILAWPQTRRAAPLSALLSHSPALTELRLPEGTPPGTETLRLRPRALSHLRSVTADATLAAALVARGTVERLHLLGQGTTPGVGTLLGVAAFATQVRTLVAQASLVSLLGRDKLSALEDLTMLEPRCMRRSQLEVNCRVSSVKSVTFALNSECCTVCATYSVRLRTQLHDLIERNFTIWFPNVTRIVLGSAIEWRRADVTAEWHPRVIDRKLVRRLLLRGDVRIAQDEDGCLIDTLGTADLTPDVANRLGYDFIELPPWTQYVTRAQPR